MGRNWFKNIAVDEWSNSSRYVVDASIIESYKWRLERSMGGVKEGRD